MASRRELASFLWPVLVAMKRRGSAYGAGSSWNKQRRLSATPASGSRPVTARAKTGTVVYSGNPPKNTKFYAVVNGRDGFFGVTTTWKECSGRVQGIKGTSFKSFPTMREAVEFLSSTRDVAEGDTLEFDVVNDHGTVARQSGTVTAQKAIEPSKAADANDEGTTSDKSDQGTDTDEQPPVTAEGQKNIRKGKKGATVRVYTDGACTNNGTKKARAGYGVFFGPRDERNISERLEGPPTNNRAELMGVLRAMEVLAEEGQQGDLRPAVIHTDSGYVLNGLTKWLQGWKKNGWKTKSRQEVKNKDLWQRLENARDHCQTLRPLSMKWVKGHSISPGNAAADKLAVEGAEMWGK